VVPPGDDARERSQATQSSRDEEPTATRLVVFCDGAVEMHPLPDQGTIVIGRSTECDVRVEHPSISRRHAQLVLGTETTVEDLGSSNGTRVGGRPLRPGHAEVVPAASVIELGSVMLALRTAGRVAGPTIPPPPPTAAGSSGPMQAVLRLVDKVAPSGLRVVLLGDTGVGKTLVAARIHRASARAKGPFVQVNCAALPEALLESELLGHERGAFTGAATAKPGLLEAADGGTLFLDEIAELPLATQAKLLHVLESGEVTRIGSVKPRAVDVRFVSATNRDLEAMVASGAFRRDLFFRLNAIAISIPPLRERVEEIAELAATFMDQAARQHSVPRGELSRAALQVLERYSWPGNVRELRNVIERAAVVAGGGTIGPEHLSLSAASSATPHAPPSVAEPGASASDLRADLEALERRRIVDALARCHGNQTRAAEELGISRRTLINRLEQYDLPRPRRDAK